MTQQGKIPSSFQFELVSPERVLASEPAVFAQVPALAGAIGVLPGHSPVLTALKPGVIELTTVNDNKLRVIFVSGGFVDISPEVCTVLAVEALPVEQINQKDVEKAIVDLEAALSNVTDATSRPLLEKALLVEQAKLEACNS